MIESTPPGGDENPFFVLELPTTATPIEVERQKQKLLGMLELDLEQARQYSTPLGPRERSSELVRRAAETLQDPARRRVWELWAAPEVAAAVDAHGGLRRRALGGEAIAASDVDAVGAAWDEVQDAESHLEAVLARPALGMDQPEAVAEAFDKQIEDQLTEVITRAPPFDLDPIGSAMGQRAVARFLDREVEGLELTCQRLVGGGAANPRQLWVALMQQYEALVDRRGLYAARAGFDAVYHELSDYAVARFNAGRLPLATEIFRWLSDQARAVGDDEAAELHTENTRIGEAALEGQRARAAEKHGFGGWRAFVIAMVLVGVIRTCLRQDSSPRDELPEIQLDSKALERIRESIKHEPEPEPLPPPPLDPQ